MMKRFSIFWLMVLTVLVLSVNGLAQKKDEVEPTNRSLLAAADLPVGALRMKESSVPDEVKALLARLVKGAGEKARQGGSEVIVWLGHGYNKSKTEQLMKIVEDNTRAAGWDFTILEKTRDQSNNELIFIALGRTEPKPRLLVGFFMLSDNGLLFALTEVLRAP